MSRARKTASAKRRVLPTSTPDKLQVIEKRLRRVRHVMYCVEVAATAEDAELELGPVVFVAVELIDRVLDDLMAIMSSGPP